MAFVYPESRYYYDWYQGEVPMDPATTDGPRHQGRCR